jgi:hypothetical protein
MALADTIPAAASQILLLQESTVVQNLFRRRSISSRPRDLNSNGQHSNRGDCAVGRQPERLNGAAMNFRAEQDRHSLGRQRLRSRVKFSQSDATRNAARRNLRSEGQRS